MDTSTIYKFIKHRKIKQFNLLSIYNFGRYRQKGFYIIQFENQSWDASFIGFGYTKTGSILWTLDFLFIKIRHYKIRNIIKVIKKWLNIQLEKLLI